MTDAEIEREVVTWHTFRIHGTSAQLDQLIAEIDRAIPAGWQHDLAKEAELRSMFAAAGYLYRFTSHDGVWGVSVWLARPKLNRVHGGQYVPSGSPPEPWADSRAVVDFYRTVVVPCAKRAGLTISGPHPVEGMFDIGTFRLLDRYCEGLLEHPDQTTPDDWRRWNEFLSAAHRSGHLADLEALTDWLVARGLPEAQARELVADYDRSLSLLESYDPEPAAPCR